MIIAKPWRIFQIRKLEETFIRNNNRTSQILTELLGNYYFNEKRKAEIRYDNAVGYCPIEISYTFDLTEYVERVIPANIRVLEEEDSLYKSYFFGLKQSHPDFLEAMDISKCLIKRIKKEIKRRQEIKD